MAEIGKGPPLVVELNEYEYRYDFVIHRVKVLNILVRILNGSTINCLQIHLIL